MAKYDGLRAHLTRSGATRLVMSFDEVSAVVPGGLPASAHTYEAWWTNNDSGNHVQARGWLEAGYRTTDLSLTRRRVTFVREGVEHQPGR